MDIAGILIVILTILVSMTLHEAMHGFMSYWLGDDTAKLQGRLTLNPIKHIDPFLTILLPLSLAVVGAPIFGGAKPVPFNPERVRGGEWGVALVALAGPLTNLIIAFVSFGLLVFASDFSAMWQQAILTSVSVNLGFFVFNMIPIPPLDGSRVLYALAPEFVQRAMEAVERFGVIPIFLIILVASSAIGSFMSSAIIAILRVFAAIYGVSL